MRGTFYSSKIHQVNIGIIQDTHDDMQVPSEVSGATEVQLVYAVSSFGILALALRQRSLNQDVFSSATLQPAH